MVFQDINGVEIRVGQVVEAVPGSPHAGCRGEARIVDTCSVGVDFRRYHEPNSSVWHRLGGLIDTSTGWWYYNGSHLKVLGNTETSSDLLRVARLALGGR